MTKRIKKLLSAMLIVVLTLNVPLSSSDTLNKVQATETISITEDFKVINIWIFDTLSDDEKFYWAVNEGY